MGDVGMSPLAYALLVGVCVTALAVCAIVAWFDRKPETYDG